MPTLLPPSRRPVEKKNRPLDIVLNTFMVISALALTFLVLVQEQRFANGQPGPLAGTLTTLLEQAKVESGGGGESPSVLPAD